MTGDLGQAEMRAAWAAAGESSSQCRVAVGADMVEFVFHITEQVHSAEPVRDRIPPGGP